MIIDYLLAVSLLVYHLTAFYREFYPYKIIKIKKLQGINPPQIIGTEEVHYPNGAVWRKITCVDSDWNIMHVRCDYWRW